MTFYKMDHRGGLKESLETRKEISQEEFNYFLPNYEFYCYDARLNCFRFILRDMEKNFNDFTTWLLLGVEFYVK